MEMGSVYGFDVMQLLLRTCSNKKLVRQKAELSFLILFIYIASSLYMNDFGLMNINNDKN